MVADAGLLNGPVTLPLSRLCDRVVATTGALYAVTPKLWPAARLSVAFMYTAAFLMSFSLILRARAVPARSTWEWVWWQSAWHVVGACFLARGCHCAADGTGCPWHDT